MKKAERALKHKNIGIQQHILKNPTLNTKQCTKNYFEFCIPLLEYPQQILPYTYILRTLHYSCSQRTIRYPLVVVCSLNKNRVLQKLSQKILILICNIFYNLTFQSKKCSKPMFYLTNLDSEVLQYRLSRYVLWCRTWLGRFRSATFNFISCCLSEK